jgi:hypothetical protein
MAGGTKGRHRVPKLRTDTNRSTALELAMRGLSYAQIAQVLRVHPRTFSPWRYEDKEFQKDLDLAKMLFADRLYKLMCKTAFRVEVDKDGEEWLHDLGSAATASRIWCLSAADPERFDSSVRAQFYRAKFERAPVEDDNEHSAGMRLRLVAMIEAAEDANRKQPLVNEGKP